MCSVNGLERSTSGTRYSRDQNHENNLGNCQSLSSLHQEQEFPDDIWVEDVDMTPKMGVMNCPSGGTTIIRARERTSYEFEFEGPIYYFKNARLNKKMKNNQCMLICKNDLIGNAEKSGIINTFHHGAFGNEYAPFPQELFGIEWYVVWKFPTDLEGIGGFRIIREAQSVGDFPMIDDHNPGDYSNDKRTMFTKFRTPMGNGPAVHHLERLMEVLDGKKYGMLTTGVFYGDFNHPTNNEEIKVDEAITAFKEIGLGVIKVNSMHHALVFHTYEGKAISPKEFANILNSRLGYQITDIIKASRLEKRHSEQDIDEWASNFITVYL